MMFSVNFGNVNAVILIIEGRRRVTFREAFTIYRKFLNLKICCDLSKSLKIPVFLQLAGKYIVLLTPRETFFNYS